MNTQRPAWKERVAYRGVIWWRRPDPIGKIITGVIVSAVIWGIGTDVVRGFVNLGHML